MTSVKLLLALFLALILTGCQNKPEGAIAENAKLNFVIIYTDELQFSDLGCYGGDLPTPNIDQLAEEGILFRSAYTTASMCTPSRYSVITGQFPGRCSAQSFLQSNPVDEPYNIAWNSWVTRDKQTLPRVLSENGYITGMSGKWHIGEVPEGYEAPRFQPDESLDDPEVDRKLRKQQAVFQSIVKESGGFKHANSVVWSNYDSHDLNALSFHNFPWVAKGALEFLDNLEGKDKPFFLYLAPTAIHGPNHRDDLDRDVTYTPGGRDESAQKYQTDVKSLIEKLESKEGINKHRYAGIAQTDYLVG
jgi:arylsulfatase A-like enzyme